MKTFITHQSTFGLFEIISDTEAKAKETMKTIVLFYKKNRLNYRQIKIN
jgi:hypothetical protein